MLSRLGFAPGAFSAAGAAFGAFASASARGGGAEPPAVLDREPAREAAWLPGALPGGCMCAGRAAACLGPCILTAFGGRLAASAAGLLRQFKSQVAAPLNAAELCNIWQHAACSNCQQLLAHLWVYQSSCMLALSLSGLRGRLACALAAPLTVWPRLGGNPGGTDVEADAADAAGPEALEVADCTLPVDLLFW